MSRYHQKTDNSQQKISKPKKTVKPKIKSYDNIDFSTEDDIFDPFHGPAPVSNEVLKKYQRGKKLDTVSIYVQDLLLYLLMVIFRSYSDVFLTF